MRHKIIKLPSTWSTDSKKTKKTVTTLDNPLQFFVATSLPQQLPWVVVADVGVEEDVGVGVDVVVGVGGAGGAADVAATDRVTTSSRWTV